MTASKDTLSGEFSAEGLFPSAEDSEPLDLQRIHPLFRKSVVDYLTSQMSLTADKTAVRRVLDEESEGIVLGLEKLWIKINQDLSLLEVAEYLNFKSGQLVVEVQSYFLRKIKERVLRDKSTGFGEGTLDFEEALAMFIEIIKTKEYLTAVKEEQRFRILR